MAWHGMAWHGMAFSACLYEGRRVSGSVPLEVVLALEGLEAPREGAHKGTLEGGEGRGGEEGTEGKQDEEKFCKNKFDAFSACIPPLH